MVSKKEGKTTVTVELAGKRLPINFTIVRLPWKIGTKAEDLIKTYGFPWSKKNIYIVWPNQKVINGFYYRPSAGTSVAVEHWRFKEFPFAVFEIENEQVKHIVSYRVGDETGTAMKPGRGRLIHAGTIDSRSSFCGASR